MPVLDLPLEELRQYRGSSPCPKDIDLFWDKALAELAAVDPDPQLIKAEFQIPNVECFDLYFTSIAKARIYAKYLRPKNRAARIPAILEFHGYSRSSGDWSEKLAYTSLGYAIAAMDCRGQGGKSIDTAQSSGNTLHGHIIRGLDDGPEALLFRSVFLDTVQLVRVLQSFPEVDASSMGCIGGSQGGALALACASLVPEIKKVAALFPFLCDYKRVWEMDMAERAYKELRDYFRNFDPQHKRAKEVFATLAYIDLQNIVPRLQAQCMLGVGLMDDVCPPSTQFAMYNKINSAKELVIFPDFGHEEIPTWADLGVQFMLDL